MHRILLSASFPESLLARQTPGRSGRWDEFQFLFAPSQEPIDGWVVYDNLQLPIEQTCPPQNTLLITGEPASVRRYRRRFTGQFGQVWTSQTGIQHPHCSLRNEAQHWHYGMRPSQSHGQPLGFDQLRQLALPEKPKLLSVICSSKTTTPDHRKRLEFVHWLKAQLGDAIDVFGRDTRPVDDKADAIWPYRYHIVLENDHTPHFMTEKISDAFLGWSYPLYFGGPEVYHRFPEGSFTAIDIYQPEQALAIIRDVLSSQTYETAIPALAEARQAVLMKNNIFAMLAEYWRTHLYRCTARPTRLLPKSHRASLMFRQLGRSVSSPRSRKAA